MDKLDYLTPLSFFFKDKDWFKKLLVASLLTCTLVGAAPVFGWMIEIVRRMGKGEPELEAGPMEWKKYWKPGGQFALTNALWLLPVLVATVFLYLPLLLANRIPSETLLLIWGAVALCVGGFLLLFPILYAFVFPAMMVRLADTDSAWKAANPVLLWRTVKPHLFEYLLVYLVVGIALFNIILVVASMTLFLLLSPLLVYAGLVCAHFAGQLFRMENKPVFPQTPFST